MQSLVRVEAAEESGCVVHWEKRDKQLHSKNTKKTYSYLFAILGRALLSSNS